VLLCNKRTKKKPRIAREDRQSLVYSPFMTSSQGTDHRLGYSFNPRAHEAHALMPYGCCYNYQQMHCTYTSLYTNMTAYCLQSETSCIGYQSVVSSSRCVFSCTTACTIYHSAICPACVSRSPSTPAANAYDQLHVVTSSSQPQKQSATVLIASPSQDQRGTCCRHHSAMTNCLSLHFPRLLKTELFSRAYNSSLARS